MKLKITFILIVFHFCALSQTKGTKRKTTSHVQKPSIESFYSSHCLQPDSALNPYLYYRVYDWIGTRYKYSGRNRKGIDCSGFVSEMYKDIYCINLSGGSREIWTNVIPVEKEELQEGDILFFKIRKGQISHVGIYLGNDKFAHAATKTGVIISDLKEDYYKKFFFKGGRPQVENQY